MYSAPSLALAALDMMALSILEMLRMAPLLGGSSTSLEQMKSPPTRLRALALLRYDVLLCIARIMSLLLHMRMTSGLEEAYLRSFFDEFQCVFRRG